MPVKPATNARNAFCWMNNAIMNDVTAKLHQLKYNGAAKPNNATNNKTIINLIKLTIYYFVFKKILSK